VPSNRRPPVRPRPQWTPEYLAAIVDSSDDAIIGKTLDGTIISWNPGAQALYGYTMDEVVGRSISILVPPERSDELPRILERLGRGERIEHFHTTRVKKSGERITVSVTISPVRDGHGAIIGASSIARDISAQQRAVDEALKVREDFVSVAAHELRTPLATIYSRLELAERHLRPAEPDCEIVRRDVAHAREAADRLRRLIDRLLDMSRISSGQLALERASTDIVELVRRTASSFAETTGRDIRFDVRDGGPEVHANVDGLRLEEVVANLLDNAVKYSPAATPIEVELMIAEDAVQVAVRDHGDGVPPGERERIFEPFERLERKKSGVGLGLHVAREIMSLHGGSLSLDGPPGGGARFVLSVPRDGNGHPEMRAD
jgi:PAS domain S-box-containing protein